MKTLFIHRSVGRNLLHDGNVRQLLKSYPDIQFDDYDQNIDRLTSWDGTQKQCGFTFPGGDTKPASYAEIFSEHASTNSAIIRDFILQYDTVIIKSCYPNSNITSDSDLAAVQDIYRSIAHFFALYPKKRFIIMTSPPLAPLRTTKANARRARQLSEWLFSTKLGDNITIFNLYDYLADNKYDWLKRPYRRWLPIDSHPNKRASENIALKFVEFIK